ncbi:MAG TPA: hypothetical protein VFG95_00705 [Nitrospiria bacterium]|nr:hypothetical protein [Nitrospiria bacterium]
MYQVFLEYGFPTLIALVFFNFVWAWTLSLTHSDEASEENRIPEKVGPEWKHPDEMSPLSVGDALAREIEPQTKVA